MELRIPKLRKGSFFPAILEPRRRIDQALYPVVIEAYGTVSLPGSVDELVEARGPRLGISKSEVSWICAGLDGIVGAFRTRTPGTHRVPLRRPRRPYLNVRNATGQVMSRHTAWVSTTRYVRDEPCSTCGQPVVVIETHSDARDSRAYQRPPGVSEQHADYRSGPGHHDAVDDQCTRVDR